MADTARNILRLRMKLVFLCLIYTSIHYIEQNIKGCTAVSYGLAIRNLCSFNRKDSPFGKREDAKHQIPAEGRSMMVRSCFSRDIVSPMFKVMDVTSVTDFFYRALCYLIFATNCATIEFL